MKYIKLFKNDAEYQAFKGGDYITPNLCLNSETWETKCEPKEEEVNLITFTIDGSTVGSSAIEYQAEKGMTWGEWVNSEYNVNGRFFINLDDSIFDGMFFIGDEEYYVFAPDIIQENYNYLLVG
jgi:hypothetical protein